MPGDAVLWRSGAGPNGMHTGIYMGNGMVRHASSKRNAVVTQPLDSIKYPTIGYIKPPKLSSLDSKNPFAVALKDI